MPKKSDPQGSKPAPPQKGQPIHERIEKGAYQGPKNPPKQPTENQFIRPTPPKDGKKE